MQNQFYISPMRIMGMTLLAEGARACQILAQNAKDTQSAERYLALRTKLRKIDAMARDSGMKDLEHARRLQPAIDASIALAKKAEKQGHDSVGYNRLTRSLQCVQDMYVRTGEE